MIKQRFRCEIRNLPNTYTKIVSVSDPGNRELEISKVLTDLLTEII